MRKLNVAFRVDASAIIGTGHVMRCLTLANQLRRDNVAVTFFCRQLSGDLTDLIAGQGFPVCRLPAPAANSERNIWRWYLENWQADARETLALLKKNNLRPDVMVVDHYGLDKKWESLLRERAESIMVIDDLANRRHQCDLLLDQNDYCEQEKRYDGLIPVSCKTLLGPDYSLLRDEFIHTSRRQRDGTIKRVLVSFGGADPQNETLKVLKVLARFKALRVDVVVGGSHPYKEVIRRFYARHPRFYVHVQTSDMAHLINSADLAIGAGGTSLWEGALWACRRSSSRSRAIKSRWPRPQHCAGLLFIWEKAAMSRRHDWRARSAGCWPIR
ncbi:UDP-2,4-diacetamido-2,4,6-trideoxy-beta-L-altropyranose hydrolase [Terrilactibacillus sp. S3-3]|nr:UDP-2,4-diacetamido-2,4,6-trideoxy-beta-L-altropyranose hydrolase [Terrilactibacillus sp. S3-3]